MANKVLEKTLNNVDADDMKAGYAAPGQQLPADFGTFASPPTSVDNKPGTMSTTGSARAALMLFSLVVAGGAWAWTSVPDNLLWPTVMISSLVAFGLAMVTIFKPVVARFTAPLYAVAEGVALGLISKIYEDAYSGIVVQAVLATGSIVFVMYVLYSTRILKVTPKFRKIVIGATLGVVVFYMLNLILSLFGANMPLINDTGMMGIAFSALIIVIAASNLALDFDFIERGSQAGLPKYMNWAAGFGLIVTIVWIYLEVLRLLAKTRN